LPPARIRFECQTGCTACCDQQGFVYLTEEDIPRLAEFLALPVDDFERRYVFRTRRLRRLRVPRHAQCFFLDGGKCGVHAAKPVQCRTFPYWPELLNSARAWKATGKWCPGIGKGSLVNIESARAQAEVMERSHPELYR
jgi:Fe-S-cluster containining protein